MHAPTHVLKEALYKSFSTIIGPKRLRFFSGLSLDLATSIGSNPRLLTVDIFLPRRNRNYVNAVQCMHNAEVLTAPFFVLLLRGQILRCFYNERRGWHARARPSQIRGRPLLGACVLTANLSLSVPLLRFLFRNFQTMLERT